MASNISNNDGNNEVVNFQAMMTNLHMIATGTSNLPPERQIELLDTMQTRVNDMFMKLRQRVSASAHQTESVAYPSYGSFQPQGSDWEEIYLHDAVSYGSGPGSSSYSEASTFSVGSNSNRRRRPSSPRVTTTASSVSSASSTSVEVSITQFVQAICDAIKSLWHQAEVEGDGNLCKTIFYFIKNIVMSFFNSTQGHVPLRYAI